MFFLQGMMSDETALDATGNLTYVDTVRISNAIFDHLTLLNIINMATNVFDTSIPTVSSIDWSVALMDATFDGNLDAGGLGRLITNISYFAIQRQEVGSNDWITIKKIYKNASTGKLDSEFTMYDHYNQSGVQYKYQLVPVDIYGNIGYAIQSDVVSYFDGAYIADGAHIYKITNDYQLTKQTNQKSAVYEPIGSKYPFVSYNADTKYDSGSITAVLLASTSENNTSAYIDRMAQVKLEKEFNEWLTNGRPKVLKDFNGMIKLVTIVDVVSNSYYKELGNGIASTSCSFVEIGEINQKYLDSLNMTKIPIYINN